MAAWFLLGLTLIECGLLALMLFLGGALIEERRTRRRAFARLEQGVEEMGRLLATDARAGQVLSQRVNALADLDLGARLDVVEADMSVLGTVVRQVAEAVADLETARESAQGPTSPAPEPEKRGPAIPLDDVRRALDEDRLTHHVQPILTLPQRKLHAMTLVPRLRIGNALADPPDFMPVPTPEGQTVIRRIERISAEEAVRIVRRARLNGEPVRLFMALSPASLSDRATLDQLLMLLAANRAVNPDLVLTLDYADWAALPRLATDGLAGLVEQGVGLALRDTTTLRLDYADLSARGVRYIGVRADTFLKTPAALTDFHSSDINDYIKRFGISLVVTGARAEAEILALLDDGIRLAEGEVLGGLGPIRADLREDGDDDLRRTATR